MDKELLNQAKIKAFAEKLRDAANNGTLEQDNSVLRMEAVELGLNDDQFNTMLEEAKRRSANDKDTQSFVKKYKAPILIVLAAFILIELFLPIGFGWKLLLIILTVVLGIVLLASVIIKRRK